jgi:subtilisin family serine protease
MRPHRVTRATCSLALLLAALPGTASPSQRIVALEHRANAADTTRLLGVGSAVRFTTDGTRRVSAEAVDPAASQRWIVSFSDAAARAGSLPERVQVRQRLAADFERALARSVPRQFGQAGVARVRVLRSFDRLIAASVVEAPADFEARLRALPGVRSVARDARVIADLAQSLHQVRGDLVQQSLGGTGRGVRVGIIDTGIDYTHPAFGGGFGPGHRVAGGWDFVNGDADPRDDHGHGTHVAGIVGGDGGGVLGMAPQATFYAYKVLDSNGSGYLSDVLAALERSADPDQDPATDDALDVVNMSLGSMTDIVDDPALAAVDALDAAGTLVVVAAGNFGMTFGVTSPGTAARAITVGSVDSRDSLSFFSSRGPTNELALKPDLVAPGENIDSAWPGGGVMWLSGTSMATPHVTGAVALLRQLHPDWTHEELRSAVVGSGLDLHLHTYEQGAGRLDAYAAATAALFVSPTSLAFGRVQPRTADWVRAETLHVRTHALLSSTATLSLRMAPLPAGVEAELAPTQLELHPGIESIAVLTLHLGAGRAPNVTPPFLVEGAVEVRTPAETRRVPFSVHDCLRLDLSSDGYREPGLVLDDRRAWPSTGPFGSSWFLPAGSYDALAFARYGSQAPFLGLTGVAIGADTLLDLPASSASAEIRWDLRDEQGRPRRPGRFGLQLLHDTGAGIGALGFPMSTSVLVPQASSHYHLEWAADDADGDVRYDIPGSLPGPLVTQAVSNDPGALRRVVEHVKVTPPDSILVEEFQLHPEGPDSYFGFAFLDPFAPPIGASYDIVRWIAPTPFRRHLRFGRTTWLVHAANARSREGPFYSGFGPVWEMDRGDTLNVLPWFRLGASLLDLTGHDIPFGTGPGVFTGQLYVDSDYLTLFQGQGYSSRLFADGVGSLTAGAPTEYEISENGQVAESGMVPDEDRFLDTGSWQHRLPHSGTWDLTLRSPGWSVAGTPSVTTVRTRFDSSRYPYFTSPQMFTVLAGGGPAERITFGQSHDPHVQFLLPEGTQDMPVALEFRPAGEAAWTPLAVTREGRRYRANLAACEGDVSLRLRIDTPGSVAARLEMEVAPAFRAFKSPGAHARLVQALADAHGAEVDWRVGAPGATLIVERSEPGQSWSEHGDVSVDADGVARFHDAAVVAGRTYGYRLSASTSEVWLRVPTADAALALSVSPDPSPRDILASLTVDRVAPLSLTLYDIQGRVVSTQRYNALAPGQHVLNLSAAGRVRPGLYFVRLVRGSDSLTRRITIIP